MSDLNNSDLNDLFRQAAENYPLRTDSADWDKIARALDEDDEDAGALPEFAESPSGSRKRSLLLLLLIPLLVAGYLTFHTTGSSNPQDAKKMAQDPHSTVLRGTGNGKGSARRAEDPAKNTYDLNQTAATGQHTAIVRDTDSLHSQSDDLRTQIITDASPEKLAARNPKSVFMHGSHRLAIRNKNNRPTQYMNQGETNEAAAGNEHGLVNSLSGGGKTRLTDGVTKNDATGLPGLWIWSTADSNRRAAFIKKPAQAKPDTVASVKHQKKTAARHYFYGGVLVAPDISTVKFQSVKGIGFTAGLLVGYHFSGRWSVESGAYLDIKKYYSKGKYFSKKNATILNGVDLLNVNGNCSMIEVPVNIRYDIHQGNRNTFFATTGLSTYFMFHQSYNYEYYVSGWTGNNKYDYNKGMQNWFSIANVSVGYEHQLGKIGMLRVEPYLRIPLSGMGTGGLPIMSGGLNLGIVRKF